MKEYRGLAADIRKNNLLEILTETADKEIVEKVMHFRKHVPFRFLSPWIGYKSDTQVEKDSQDYKNEAPYAIFRDRNTIVINSTWISFLKSNYKLLIDYGYWCLSQYVQSKNPGVPDIAGKLIKPAVRGSLVAQRMYWQIVFDQVEQLQCIYTHKQLTPQKFDVEHYIPWSFTAHNLIWNLVPADSSINSSKNNKLPNKSFLKDFVDLQRMGLQIVFDKSPKNKLLDDFAVFGVSVKELLNLPSHRFFELYDNQISPQLQLAHQLGFAYWNYPNH
ncbi:MULTISPECIES: HNH endonuclease domain-containing protein [unclassified Carboxylicivirga]|uniref:HNH endonuclease domain-containing protein n=1 Tax=Carboxylicivirga TaxID=1628153 RepID=UPI003D34D4EA